MAKIIMDNMSDSNEETRPVISTIGNFSLDMVPEYSGKSYVSIRNNIPYFYSGEIAEAEESYIKYSELDALGRSGSAIMSAHYDLMPAYKFYDITDINPSGYTSSYEKCQLLGFALTETKEDEKDAELIKKNLITCTTSLKESIQTIESTILQFIEENPDKHCLYRVTPIYEGDNLICSGVLIEGLSVEDIGKEVMFCIYCYNIEPETKG